MEAISSFATQPLAACPNRQGRHREPANILIVRTLAQKRIETEVQLLLEV